jgi:predicted Fe-Mo cluster-binding NifX family protein
MKHRSDYAMNVVLPIWNERISPVFDTSRRIMVIRIEADGSETTEEIDLGEVHPVARVKMLERIGADILICGAVSNPVARLVEATNIRIIPWVSGSVKDVIDAFRRGELDEPCFRMPGCGRMRRRVSQRRGGSRRRRGLGRGGD